MGCADKEMMMVRLEVGKFYETGKGEKVGPMMLYGSGSEFHVGSSDNRLWWPNGESYSGNTDGNIIAEWTETPAEVIGENVRVIPINEAPYELFDRMAETLKKPYEVIGADVESFNAETMPESLLEQLQAAYPQPRSKYHRIIKGVEVDIYDILVAWGVTCPARQHAIKKLLMAGERGAKGVAQDLDEAIQATERAKELVE